MFDVDALAQQVLLTDDFLPESYTNQEEVLELRPVVIQQGDLSASEILEVLKQSPDRSYRIGEVAEILSIKIHVLRYWETEFRVYIRPQKTKGGQRLYKLRDIENLMEIKKLLYKEKYSIDGAKKKLRAKRQLVEIPTVPKDLLVVLKEELEALHGEINDVIGTLPDSFRSF